MTRILADQSAAAASMIVVALVMGLGCSSGRLPKEARPVIVELKLIDAECTSPPDDACLVEIQRVRKRVLAQLEGTPYRVTGAYRNVPFLALRASPAALERLRSSGWVKEIREDGLAVPLSRGRQ